ncbi:MAG: CDGSH iron-sulfur domain-containing protein [Deferribacteraceae bacterium]|jgi:CDGSH-type Zn-finger protein|nr:CDGSH iron-sulfur domain-containing protein [Deferribacteraceae bacterium]
MSAQEIYIKVVQDGPYMVYGDPKIMEQIIVTDEKRISVGYEDGELYESNGVVALCRCGNSENAPFCDGAHKHSNFNGTEYASFEPFINGADAIEGPRLTLLDNSDFCAYGRFCDAGERVWKLTQLGHDELATREACDCPAGRLVMLDENDTPIEPSFEPTLAMLEDTALKISGPIWVKGGVRVESADGRSYEVRNRQTLCRCGQSENKPFCNGAHAAPSVRYKANKRKGI